MTNEAASNPHVRNVFWMAEFVIYESQVDTFDWFEISREKAENQVEPDVFRVFHDGTGW